MITQTFLQEYFRNHDSLTLYRPNGTTVTFSKQFYLVLTGGYSHFEFRDYDEFLNFYKKHNLQLEPNGIIV